jgi:release factor glutamine methyltransferase
MTAAEALRMLEPREARLLLARATGFSEAAVLAHPERELSAEAETRFGEFAARRARGEPIAYILGEKEFYGLALAVSPAVLIPRPETELLVELALERIDVAVPCGVLDVGTGSGCIAICLALHRPSAHVVATDLSAAALEVAKRNAARHAVTNLELMLGSAFAPVAGRRFDLVVSNPPYIAGDDPHLGQGDLRFEPAGALTPGGDGTLLLRQLVAEAPAHLRRDGWLLLEHGYDQGAIVSAALRSTGFDAVFTARDLAGHERVSGGRVRGG